MGPSQFAKTVWNAIGHLSTLSWAGSLFVAFVAASGVMSVMPGGWHPPQYWLLAGSVVFGVMLVAQLTVRAGQWASRKVTAPRISVNHYGGENASLVVTNHGPGSVKYLATGQLLESSEVPFKRQRPFNLPLWRGHPFKPLETAAAVIAETYSQYNSVEAVWLRGDGTDVIDRWETRVVDGKWVRFTVTIHSDPPARESIRAVYEWRYNNRTRRFEMRPFTQ